MVNVFNLLTVRKSNLKTGLLLALSIMVGPDLLLSPFFEKERSEGASPYQLSGAAYAASSQAIGLNNEGVKALNAGNFAMAIDRLQQALKIDPTYTIARENLAIAYNNFGLTMQNNPQAALVQFHKSLALAPTNATALQNLNTTIAALGRNPSSYADRAALGKAARSSGDIEGAIVEWNEALKLKDDPKIRLELATVYTVRDQVDNAIAQYKILAKSPGLEIDDQTRVLRSLGQCYQAKRNYGEAASAYAQAIRVNPGDRDTLESNLAVWNEAVKLEPTSPDNHVGLAQAFVYLGDFGQAKAELNMALTFNKSHPQAQKLMSDLPRKQKEYDRDKHINAGVDLQQRKNYDAAIQEYKMALSTDPNNATVWVNIGSALQAKEDFQGALDAYNKAKSIEPSNATAQQGLQAAQDGMRRKMLADAESAGANLFKMGRYDEALLKYQEILRSNPQNAGAHFNVGAAYHGMKRFDEAIAEYRQAIQFEPKNDAYKQTLQKCINDKVDPIIAAGVKKHGDKDYTGAIDLYLQALTSKPDDIPLLYNLASAYYARQQFSDAKRIFEKLLQMDRKAQLEDLWLLGTIEEHNGKGPEALAIYTQYLTESPNGKNSAAAKERVAALRKDPKDTQRIKSESELAQEKDADEAYQSGIALQKAGRFDEATTLYQKAMAVKPKEAAYPFALGTLFQQKGDMDSAAKWYQTALDLAKNGSKFDAKLVDQFQKALNNAYELQAKPIVDQAVAKQTAGDGAGAVELYKKALLLLPKEARVWTNLGSAYQLLDDFANARSAYQKGVEVDPKTENSNWFLIAAIDEHFGQGQQALVDYRKYIGGAGAKGDYVGKATERISALTKNINDTMKLPTQGEIKNSKIAQESYDEGVRLQQAGKFDEALPLYMRAAQANDKEPAFPFAVGTIYQAKSDIDNAISWYKKAQAMSPANKDFQKALDAAYLLKADPIVNQALEKYNAGDFVGAAALYGQVIDLVPNNAPMHTSRAAALQAADDFAGAEKEYKQAYKIDPKGQKDVLYFVAALAEHFGRGSEALGTYRTYITECPTGQFVKYAGERAQALSKNVMATVKMQTSTEQKSAKELGDIFDQGLKAQQAGKCEEAVAAYKQCVEKVPTNAGYWYALGTAYQCATQLDSAVEAYNKAIQLDGKNSDYKRALEQANDAKAAPLVDAAVKLHTAGDLLGAIEGYRKALQMVPKYARLHTNLATALQASDDFNGARAEFSQALTLDPKGEVDNNYLIAVLDEHFSKGAQALQGYLKYVQSAPKGTYVALAQERIRALQANPNAVQKLSTQAESQKATQANESFQKAIQLQQENKLDEALQEYTKAGEAAPNSDAVWYSMGTCYQAKADLDNAIRSYEKAIGINGKEPNYKSALKSARQAKAAPLLEAAYQKQVATPSDIPGAIVDYENALRIDEDGNSRMNLAIAYQQMNNLPKSLENYKKAVLLDPKLVDNYYYMGTVYEGMKQPALAIQEYKRYLQSAPAGSNAAEAKNRIKILGGK